MKVTSIRESTIMSTLTLDVLYSKLKPHGLNIFLLGSMVQSRLH
jgi:hypothetical protein